MGSGEGMSDVVRMFIAVDIDDEVLREKIARIIESLKGVGADIKPVEPENLHITLRFLGNTPLSMLDELEEAIKKSIEESGAQEHEIAIKGVGAFPVINRPRVIWLGVEGAETLSSIATRLESKVRKLGFAPERKGFTPHITLARVRSSRNIQSLVKWIQSMQDIEVGVFRVKSIRIKQSILRPSGPIYKTLREVKL